LLKETTGAFDGAQTHNLHITSQTCNPMRHAAMMEPSILDYRHINSIAAIISRKLKGTH